MINRIFPKSISSILLFMYYLHKTVRLLRSIVLLKNRITLGLKEPMYRVPPEDGLPTQKQVTNLNHLNDGCKK